MATSFSVNKADLVYILKQIYIAEAHAAGGNLSEVIQAAYGVGAADAAQLPAGLRTVDGTLNSLVPGQSRFGAADTLFPRLTDPVFRNEEDEAPFGNPMAPMTNTDYRIPGIVIDSDPRTISNAIVDMSVNNPAAVGAFLNNPLSLSFFQEKYGKWPTADLVPADDPYFQTITNDDLQTIPNQSPDIGLSPGFNSWMTFFGQFFDHGLDLVTKGNAGTVYIPLNPDDPLYDHSPSARTNFMALTRATQTLDANGVPQHENTTTSWIDQNQTYTSHPAHQVFLREYVLDHDDRPVSTGRLLDGKAANGSLDGAIGNWAEVKAQALEMLGIKLNDFDVHNVPLVLTDQYGRFIPDPITGYAQLVKVDSAGVQYVVAGNPDGSVATDAFTVRTNHAFLNDIAHHAAPSFIDFNRNGVKDGPDYNQVADTDVDINGDGTIDHAELVTDDHNPDTYDNEMLDAHFITGDGRGNENIALTTVHSIFHSEHNRLVQVNKDTIAESAVDDPAFVRSWLLNGDTANMSDQSTWQWNGERLFQAARFGTEMQYQHLVFEEFARRIQPMVDPFIFNSAPELDPSIVAEFAHTVYRFGHSMLTGTVDRLDNNLDLLNGDLDQKTLLAVFLNPQAYLESGTTLEDANANIIRGLSRDVGNAIDEFIVTNVRSQLLGLPLDLGALNLARGRDTGIPSLNETRAQLYNDTGLADLIPYTSWYDFAMNLKNTASIVNFVAAYGTHQTIVDATTLADKRIAAENLVFYEGSADPVVEADRQAFINGTGGYAADLGGLNVVDLWIGGLAEKSPEFGGMLGSTFNYVFEAQMENLQFGDRMYYLTRTQGLNFLNQLEPNTFSDLVMRNTALGDIHATHLNGALFTTPDHIIELDQGIAQTDYNGDAAGNDPLDPHSILGPKVMRDYSGANDTVLDGHNVGGFLRVRGGEHFVLGGTEGNDRMWGDSGIDTLWGDGGNDYLNGMTESDDVFGGEGDDIIEDPFGDDVLRGNQGNDVITSARGADLMFGDAGADYILLGQDASEAFGGTGNDFMLGGAGKDFLLGNEGDDWMEGGAGFDTLAGDNSELFFNSPIIGHDVMFGQGDETDYDAESGDDIMGSGPSVFRYEGMFGFDWGIAKNDLAGVHFDLAIPIFTTIPTDVLRDRFDQVEGLSGWVYDDRLDGDDRGHKGGGSSAPDAVPTELFTDHMLTQEGIDRIDGLQEWIAGARETLFGGLSPVPGSAPVTNYRDGNILMGGDGNDFLRGRGGYDLLDGDAWLNVRIKIDHKVFAADGSFTVVEYSAESMSSDQALSGPNAGKVLNLDGSVAFNGRSLNALMLDRTLNPGELSIVREIKYDDTNTATDAIPFPEGMNIDTAIFQGTMAEYEIEGFATGRVQDVDGDGWIFVRDRDTGAVGAVITGPDGQPLQLASRGLLTDDRDLLKNIEQLQFADQTIAIGGNNNMATGTVTISDPTPFDGKVTPYVGQVLTATLSNFADLDGIPLDANGMPVGLNFEWQTTEFGSNAGWSTIQTSLTYTVRSVDPGHILRAVAVFHDANGVTERIFSAATDNPTVAFSVNENSDPGTVVGLQIPFNVDYDPEPMNGQPPADVDLATLHHEIDPLHNAGGRFTVVQNGVDLNGFPRYSLVVGANGGGAFLNHEVQDAYQLVDNQYQVIINTYDAPGGIHVAQRQFTIHLNDVEPEVTSAPTDIRWVGVSPTGAPAAGEVVGQLVSEDASNDMPFAYGLTGAGFAINEVTGVVTRTGSTLPITDSFTLLARSTDNTGGTLEETFTVRTGGPGENNLAGSTGADGNPLDDVIYGFGGDDTLNGGGGDDNLFGMGGDDELRGGGGDDILDGGAGDDTVLGGGADDIIRYRTSEGTDSIDGGTGADTVEIKGDANDSTVTITLVGGTLTSLNGGDVTNIESVALDLQGGRDTVVFTSSTAVEVHLGTGTASGSFASFLGVENVTGGTGNDLLNGSGANNVLSGEFGNDILMGGLGSDALNGGVGNDALYGGGGNDTLDGGAGDDTVEGGAGADLISYTAGDGVDSTDGGGGTDTLAITGGPANNQLAVAVTGGLVTGVNGGTVAAIEVVTLNLGGGTDTVTFASDTGVNVNLANGTATGFSSFNNVENVIGSAGADTIRAGAGVNVLRGGGGVDSINLNAGNDNEQDIIQFTAASDFGDLVLNFDMTGPVGQQDRVEFTGALGTELDDMNLLGGTGLIQFVSSNSGAGEVSAAFNNVPAGIEALLLTGVAGEGVTTVNLGNATAVSNAVNAEFAITGNATRDALFVVNDTNGSSFALWFWQQDAGAVPDTTAAELSLIGIFNGNGNNVTADNFDFV